MTFGAGGITFPPMPSIRPLSEIEPTPAPEPKLPVDTSGKPLRAYSPSGRKVIEYDPRVALAIVERIAEGELLVDIAKEPGMPSTATFHRWAATQPKLMEAFTAAKAMSAMLLEEKAIKAGEAIMQEPGTAQKVSAYGKAMEQYRWSAERRDPRAYAPKNNDKIIVPIQINTTLDLAGESMGTSDLDYQIEVPVEQESNQDQSLYEQAQAMKGQGKGRKGPRKQVLRPRIPMDADTRAVLAARKLAKEAK